MDSRPSALVCVFWLFYSTSAFAVIQSVHDASIAGNGSVAPDGFNLSRDADAGLEWLDLDLSTNMSFADVNGEFEPGGLFAGFRYATANDIRSFWAHAGVTPGVPVFDTPTIAALQAVWGITSYRAPRNETFAQYVPTPPDHFGDYNPAAFLAYSSERGEIATLTGFFMTANFENPRFGPALVRDMNSVVPEPATILLAGFAVCCWLATAFARRRKGLPTADHGSRSACIAR